ncbi:MAG: guanylate kinase [Candidatus Latescibacteria bacterium]|nr:guanylate kinase [Candidatus Latescibacterota bacterium]
MNNRGFPLIISAPSGAGKTSICYEVLRKVEEAEYSVSITTRARRSNERDGVDYHFVTPEQFEEMIGRGELAEWAEVHDNLYGTLKAKLSGAVERGKVVVLDIDGQGAKSLKRSYPDSVLIFIFPPSPSALQERLSNRGTNNEISIRKRLKGAPQEIENVELYDYVIVNEEFEDSVEKIVHIIEAEKCALERMRPFIEKYSEELAQKNEDKEHSQ